MRFFLLQTRAEQRATAGGINLFFGALIGAHLGAYTDLPLNTFTTLVMLLAGAVLALQTALHSERRLYTWSIVAVYAALLVWSTRAPTIWPRDQIPEGLDKVLVTFAVWLFAVVTVTVLPTLDGRRDLLPVEEDA